METQTTQANRQVTTAEQQGISSSMPRVVIIGAGFGGLKAAKELGKVPVHLTVIDRDNYHLFQPMLYQVATAGLSPDDISMSIRQILRKQHNTEVCLAEVTDIDVQGQKVITADKSIPFDYLIVATGATSNYFGHEDWQKYAPGLKTLDDGMKLRDKILLAFEDAEKEPDPEKRQALLTFVLVGGGPTGVELAGALADLSHESLSGNFRNIRPSSARIILVEGKSRIMPTFPASLTRKASQHLNRWE
jgi:NADH:quinone reductase (non-electrogenic)